MSEDRGAAGRLIDGIEETLIALILGLMTMITFANVVARYVFNSNILWALETTSFLFSWLVLLGASYAVKKTAHLGVDAVLNAVSRGPRRIMSVAAALVCIAYALLLLKGAWDFWAPYAELSPTSGRWFPTGFEDVRGQGWYELNDIPMPAFMNQAFADVFNLGERYEKMPRLIPYAILPLSMLLLVVRFVQAGIGVATGRREMLIVSHEAEDAVDEITARRAMEDGGR